MDPFPNSGSMAALAGYGLAVLLCLRAGGMPGWRMVAALLALVAAERLFRVGGALVDATSAAAVRGGWYEARRPLQTAVVALLALGGAAAALAAVASLPARDLPARIATGTTVLLGAFVLARAVSLHQVDRVLERQAGPLRIGAMVEALLLLVILAAAAVAAPARNGGG